MEILTLLKANIRHKKGSFFSIILLMITISMSLTTILSININVKTGIKDAAKQVNAGNLNVYISEQKLTDKLFNDVKNNKTVKDAVAYPAIYTSKITIGSSVYTNSCFVQKLRPEYRILNKSLNGYADETPKLQNGEIYIPQGLCTSMKCTVGDTISLEVNNKSCKLKIKGIVVEPVNGSSFMGWKQLFISDQDFDKIYSDAKAKETGELSSIFRVLKIFKADNSALSDSQFRRQLNLNTKIIDNAAGSITKAQSIYFTSIFLDVIGSILLVFISFLMAAVLVVMGHSISTGIEMDYVSLGVLKSQGFSKNKIRLIFILQYILAEIIGMVLGIAFSFFLVYPLSDVLQPITAIPAPKHVSVVSVSLAVLFAVLAISAMFITFLTGKIGRISPVRAISGGRREIYFDSRLKAPVSKRALLPSLALRQFTSNKRQYTGLILIVSILVFFMMTIMIIGNSMNSKNALRSMGVLYSELELKLTEKVDDNIIEDIEKTIKNETPIHEKHYLSKKYMSLNGETLYSIIYKNPETLAPSVLKGRAPLYGNEIMVTEIVSDELGLKMGDKVTVSHGNKSAEYIISGCFQYMNEAGMCFAMSFDGTKKLGISMPDSASYNIGNPSKSEKLVQMLNKKYSGILTATDVTEENEGDDIYSFAVNTMKVVIYAFSVIFSLVVVHMVCSKAFLRDKTDIGIYKAMGFTSGNLRLQFAVRFLIIAAIGSAFGTVFSMLFSGKLINIMLKNIGISSFAVELTAGTFLVPIALICGCFFVFAYLVSRKIKSVSVRELVVE